jgi:serine phosphatase RsbU (regulator of sigma subunit)/PAS domain-containing protein
VTAQSAAPQAARDEAGRLKASGDALRQAAGLPGADPRSLLEAALAELDGAVEALTAAGEAAAADPGAGPGDGPHTERRLLQAVFQQAPVPLFLLGPDGTVRRANSAAGQLLGSGSGSGYPTGKPFASFVEMPSRAALQSQLGAVARTGRIRSLRCGVLAADGTAEREVTLCPVRVRGESDQLIVAISQASGGARPAPAAAAGREPSPAVGDEALRAVIRRLDLATAATRILLENIKHGESVTMQRFARLLSGELAAWLILDVERQQGLRRQLAVGPDDQSDELARAVAAVDPPPGSAACQVHESGSSLLVAHAEDAGMLGDGPDGVPLLMQLGATSVLCVPLSDGERSYGALTLARPAGPGHFGMADVGLVSELGEQLALAMRAERMFRHSTEVASALQASVLPRRLRQIPGVEVAASHVPATTAQDAGADFYDVYPAQDGWGISIGDVCGKGQDAAAVTAAARHAIRVLAHWDRDPARILRKANEIMMEEEEFGGRFVTASVAHLRWRDGGWHVLLGSAGHPWPVLIKSDGRTERLQGSGLPLGIFADAEPSAQEFELVPGDLLFFFSDGLTGACGPDMVYFDDRLTDELAALAGEPADRVVGRVREIVLEFCRGQLRDDMTMLALRAGEPPAD